MLDKYEADWILNELAELRRELLGRIDTLERTVQAVSEKLAARTPVDHEKVAENIAAHSEEALGFFRQTPRDPLHDRVH